MNYIYRILTLCSMGGVGGARSGAQLRPDSLAHLMLHAPGPVGVRCKNTVLSPTVMESSLFFSRDVISSRNRRLIMSVLGGGLS